MYWLRKSKGEIAFLIFLIVFERILRSWVFGQFQIVNSRTVWGLSKFPYGIATILGILFIVMAIKYGFCRADCRGRIALSYIEQSALIAGICLNVYDRLVKGGVIDYVFFLGWQFNIADLYIIAVLFILIGRMVFG